jgi:hypothetical protein
MGGIVLADLRLTPIRSSHACCAAFSASPHHDKPGHLQVPNQRLGRDLRNEFGRLPVRLTSLVEPEGVGERCQQLIAAWRGSGRSGCLA